MFLFTTKLVTVEFYKTVQQYSFFLGQNLFMSLRFSMSNFMLTGAGSDFLCIWKVPSTWWVLLQSVIMIIMCVLLMNLRQVHKPLFTRMLYPIQF